MQEIYHQLFCLLVFIITGIVIGIVFDIFRILRRSFRTVDWITYIQDTLFWIIAGGILLFSIFKFNNGEIRSYIFIGLLLGIIFYMLTISKILIKSSVTIILFLKKILSYPIHFIQHIINKIIITPCTFVLKKVRSITTKSYKKIYNTTKFNIKFSKNKEKIKEKEGISQKM